MENIVRDVEEGLGLRVKLRMEDHSVKSLSNLSISLSIRGKARDIKSMKNVMEDAMEAWSF